MSASPWWKYTRIEWAAAVHPMTERVAAMNITSWWMLSCKGRTRI